MVEDAYKREKYTICLKEAYTAIRDTYTHLDIIKIFKVARRASCVTISAVSEHH